jgi:hypothetical protein
MLDDIRAKIARDEFEFSRHALDQSVARSISLDEFRQAIVTAEVIEDYPNNKYGPSCLLLGYTAASRPIHVHLSYPSRPLVRVVTLHEPDPARWRDNRIRMTP